MRSITWIEVFGSGFVSLMGNRVARQTAEIDCISYREKSERASQAPSV